MRQLHLTYPISNEIDDDCIEIVLPPTFHASPETSSVLDSDQEPGLIQSCSTKDGQDAYADDDEGVVIPELVETEVVLDQTEGEEDEDEALGSSLRGRNQRRTRRVGVCDDWRPLLLIIPLRLGLHQLNPDYIEALKVVEWIG
ncbi:unnamed protein product [Protopolystoma xenopodis]|uniref:Uncharacterized protein n=1 Tax=Protopolystoma xenopodis TaxID=117903 RepID=A0A448WWX5_9PLAT|nr:unnamed protein product [Protopolystoma xenopodis]